MGKIFFYFLACPSGSPLSNLLTFCINFHSYLPIYFLITFLYRKQHQTNTIVMTNDVASIKKNTLIVIITSAILLVVGHYVTQQKNTTLKDDKLAKLQISGYNKGFKEDGVVEFSKKNIVIYVKPFTKAYASDHPPSICWQGAGFKIEELHTSNYNSYEVLSAILKKDNIIQYTAWWYDNGKDKTINQWKWRLAKGEPYRIINITTNNKVELDSLCHYFLKQNLF